ncbi:MAG: hypothetical protein M3P06_16590 [Acidobacteriota bacterium]|nr:hypothetical protein [Acidobacteriota bacterium]
MLQTSDVNETIISEPDDELLSAGTPAESAAIQLLETMAAVSAAVAAGLTVVSAVGLAIVTGMVALGSLVTTWFLRRERVCRNEEDARSARAVRYSFPEGREDTIQTIETPADLKGAVLSLVGAGQMSRTEISSRLSARVGQARVDQYLSLVLQHADRHTH